MNRKDQLWKDGDRPELPDDARERLIESIYYAPGEPEICCVCGLFDAEVVIDGVAYCHIHKPETDDGETR